MKLAVGDVVVYGTHGIGRVAARKKQAVQGAAREIIVLELADGLTVTLPLERAHEQLRAAATKADLDRVREILREDRDLSTDSWLSRRGETTAKLTGGGLVGLAEIVSAGAQRERLRLSEGKSRLSPGERDIFVRARELLAGEVALALSVPQSAADSWIEEQLARPS